MLTINLKAIYHARTSASIGVAVVDRKSLRNQFISFVISAVILVIGFTVYAALAHQPEQGADASPTPRLPVVKTVAIREHKGSLDIEVDGIVTPYREIEVAAEVGGRVIYKNEACNGGVFVKKGTPLIRIDPRDYELEQQRLGNQLAQAEANLSELAVQVSNTEALIKLARDQVDFEHKEIDRLAGLIQERIVTDSAMDKAKQAELAARNALVRLTNELQLHQTRKTGLQSAKALVETSLEKAQLDIDRTKVAAAVDGLVVQDMVEQDSYVQKGAPLFTLEDTSAVEVKCQLRMEELHWLWRQASSDPSGDNTSGGYQIPQTRVTVTYQVSGRESVHYEWQGVLSRYDGGGMDEVTRTVACRVVVPDPRDVKVMGEGKNGRGLGAPPALVRGMFVGVRLHIDQPDRLALVPEQAVQPGKALWVVRDGVLSLMKPLTLIELVEKPNDTGQLETFWLVEAQASRLSFSDRVVVPPFAVLAEDMAVRESEAE